MYKLIAVIYNLKKDFPKPNIQFGEIFFSSTSHKFFDPHKVIGQKFKPTNFDKNKNKKHRL